MSDEKIKVVWPDDDLEKAFVASQHPRGQPNNPGQFAPKGRGLRNAGKGVRGVAKPSQAAAPAAAPVAAPTAAPASGRYKMKRYGAPVPAPAAPAPVAPAPNIQPAPPAAAPVAPANPPKKPMKRYGATTATVKAPPPPAPAPAPAAPPAPAPHWSTLQSGTPADPVMRQKASLFLGASDKLFSRSSAAFTPGGVPGEQILSRRGYNSHAVHLLTHPDGSASAGYFDNGTLVGNVEHAASGTAAFNALRTQFGAGIPPAATPAQAAAPAPAPQPAAPPPPPLLTRTQLPANHWAAHTTTTPPLPSHADAMDAIALVKTGTLKQTGRNAWEVTSQTANGSIQIIELDDASGQNQNIFYARYFDQNGNASGRLYASKMDPQGAAHTLSNKLQTHIANNDILPSRAALMPLHWAAHQANKPNRPDWDQSQEIVNMPGNVQFTQTSSNEWDGKVPGQNGSIKVALMDDGNGTKTYYTRYHDQGGTPVGLVFKSTLSADDAVQAMANNIQGHISAGRIAPPPPAPVVAPPPPAPVAPAPAPAKRAYVRKKPVQQAGTVAAPASAATGAFAYKAGTKFTLDQAAQLDVVKNYTNHRQKMYSKGDEDFLMESIYHSQSFDEKPEVLDQKEFNKAVRQGGLTVLYRGLKTSGGRAQSAKTQYSDQFKYSDYFGGLGIYGNGTYASKDLGDAKSYGGFGTYSEGDVIKMAIRPEAKIVDHDDPNFHREIHRMTNAISAKYTKMRNDAYQTYSNAMANSNGTLTASDINTVKSEYRKIKSQADDEEAALSHILSDTGRVAALLGYDVMDCRAASGSNYFVVLNRSAVIVQKESAV
jgi:hypothetical protein